MPTADGHEWLIDGDGGCWRCYLFVPRTVALEVVGSPAQAYQAGLGFADFIRLLGDLPGERLHETIPDFHHTRRRFEALLASERSAKLSVASQATVELQFFHDREDDVDHLLDLLQSGRVLERVSHNDTKVENLLLDVDSRTALCVTDLDTSMPGLAAYDYGDLVRTVTSPVAEDHPDPGAVEMQFALFIALSDGYLEAGRRFLSEQAAQSLIWGARLMTMEVGLRFLADYLSGDVYFKTTYPEHNLIRARTQIALLQSIERQRPRLEAHVAASFAKDAERQSRQRARDTSNEV